LNFLAADLGETSDRVMDCRWDGSRFSLEEIHSFPNEACALAPACNDNAMVRAVATGHLKNLDEGREALERSVHFESFFPAQMSAWREAFERYQAVVCQYRNLAHEASRV
jgi:hypothetical protein